MFVADAAMQMQWRIMDEEDGEDEDEEDEEDEEKEDEELVAVGRVVP